MHIIEHVSGINFTTDSPHKLLKLSNELSLQAKRGLEEATKGKGKGKGASGSTSRDSPPCASHSRHAHSEEPVSSSSSGGKPPSKFKFFMKYMFGACCASVEQEQEMLVRMHRIEQKLDIHSVPLHDLERLCDPFELYDEACKEYYGESSDQPHRHGKQQASAEDEYVEDDDDDDDDGGADGDHDDDEDYKDE